MNELINKYSKGPNISFWPVEVIYKTFRAHVNWASYGNILENLVGFDGKTKITEFISVLMDKNIRYFKITVDDAKIG